MTAERTLNVHTSLETSNSAASGTFSGCSEGEELKTQDEVFFHIGND